MKYTIMHIICAFGWSKERKHLKFTECISLKYPLSITVTSGNFSVSEVPNIAVSTVLNYFGIILLRIFRNI
jgi:hypothetical protein